ncbi:MAG: peptidoglycan DD-metalloendopeptidase family protein [Bacteroidales bacterium]|nr:peptidoglycan DD-metalloendopeptidase family protein [Bacteroidales bacterium]MBQ2501015.1 peptidoglycan DD-metalloendopeptidase family protein [Bacteroidales bacterium]
MNLNRTILAALAALICVAASGQEITKKKAEILVPRPALQPVKSLDPLNPDVIPMDTLDTSSPARKIILYTDNTWRYWIDGDVASADTTFTKHWNTNPDAYGLQYDNFPIRSYVWLMDSTDRYHFPGSITPTKVSSRYGRRRGRYHRGTDMPMPKGSEVYATFDGKVRVAKYSSGYGNLVVIRHSNGLETFYGHLSQINVKQDQWVEAGQVIGLCGATGRASGSHLHYEVRYLGYAIDPEWMLDMDSQELRQSVLVIKKSMLYPDSSYSPESDDEEEAIAEADEADRLEQERLEAERKAAKYVTIKSGDTLSTIAKRNGTTVSALCKLNNITTKTILRVGRTLRVK